MEKDCLIILAENLCLTRLDIILLIACPICTALGTSVSGVLGKNQNNTEENTLSNKIQSTNQLGELARIFIGLVLGLIIALYFVGAITQNITSLARILALCILLGYQAPNIWYSQEKVISRLVELKLQGIIEDKAKDVSQK